MTDAEITDLCTPDEEELTEGVPGERNKANHDFSYQGKFIEIWHEIRGLPMDKVKEKWMESQKEGKIPKEFVWVDKV